MRTGDQTLVFDCGPASVRRMLEAGVELPSIGHLFLTHLHYDHCIDYAYLALTRWDQGAGRIPELRVYGPPPTAHMTRRLFAPDGVFGPDLEARTVHPGSHFVYEARGGVMPRRKPDPQVRELSHGDRLVAGAWKVEVAEVTHVQPQLTCLAYRLTTPGGTIVFGGDTAPVPRLTELARDADVLLHMCHFVNGAEDDERLARSCSGHLDAAATARDAGVKTLVLVHLTEQLETPGVQERVLHEVGEVFKGQVILGRDLLDVPLGAIGTERVR